MYGMPGNRYGNELWVQNPKEVLDLVKEAQTAGKTVREFRIGGQKRLKLSYDGMFLINNQTGDILDEEVLLLGPIFTPVMYS